MAQSCDRIVHSLRCQGVIIDVIFLSRRATKLSQGSTPKGLHITFPLRQDPSHSLNLLWNFLQNPTLSLSSTHLLAFGGHLPILAAPVFSSWLNIPLITCIRGNDFDSALFMPKRRDSLKDALMASASVCVVSKDKMTKIDRWVPGLSLYYTPNGIDLADWKPTPSELKQARLWRHHEFSEGMPKQVIGLFGHLKAKKGADVLFEGIRKSGLSGEVHLLMTGEVDIDHEIPCSHTLLPFMDRHELLSWYPACDLVAIPSHYEGMPNVLLEAGALGIPLLVSRIDGMKDIIEDDSGYMFHPGDAEACSAALKSWFAKKKLAKEKAAKLQQLIKQSFTAEAEAKRYVQLLKETSL